MVAATLALTPRWTPLNYHRLQSELWRCDKRLIAVAAGRGSGKTELARRRIVRYLQYKRPWPDPIYVYALPTIPQAKKIAWQPLLDLIPPDWIADVNITEMRIRTKFGSTLYVVGLDQPQRIEGQQIDGFVNDESSDTKPGIMAKVVFPMLTWRSGWLMRIGVPKRYGIGAQEFKAFYDNLDGTGAQASFTWPSYDVAPQAEIEFAKAHLDSRDFEEQYGGAWLSVSGRIFYQFDEQLHVTEKAEYDPSLRVVVGSDFNVNPMAWVLGHFVNDAFVIFDEIFRRDTNTAETLDWLASSKYGKHCNGWDFYGDATAASRKTSAALTDYIQIKNDRRFKDSRTYYPDSNPPVINRIASCNAMFKNARGDVRIQIHPRCKQLRQDLLVRVWKSDKREPDDSGDIGHITDAFGYPIYRRYPLRVIGDVESRSKVILRGA